MTAILLIAHAPLASALAQCVEHVYSCEPTLARTELRALDIEPGVDVDAALENARGLLRQLHGDAGVLVLTDAFGATPGNIATRLAEPGRVAVVAGVNLPMLLRAVCYRSGVLADVVERALAGGQQGMLQVGAAAVQHQTTSPPGDDPKRFHHQQ